MNYSSLELCAGGGGQALGLEMAGFGHEGVLECEPLCCDTIRLNRPRWKVLQTDIREFSGEDFAGVDLLAGGVPCPPFSIAGKQLGENDDRDMFPAALRLVETLKPRAVAFENVRGLASAKFADYRKGLLQRLSKLGYQPEWKLLHASDFGVPQLRPRFVLVALRPRDAEHFRWPSGQTRHAVVGATIVDLMKSNGWSGAEAWAIGANKVAPTIVGGSKKHGGPDLGPTRAKMQWRELGVDGMGIANDAPACDFPTSGLPRLTVRMVARIQGFPDSWKFVGKKTGAYRQVGNAFPPPVAAAVGRAIRSAFERQSETSEHHENEDLEARLLEQSPPILDPCLKPKVQKR